MNLNIEIKGQGFPILCLHGHPGSSRSLSVFTHPLSKQFQTLAPDLRGYGKSRAKAHFQMSDHLSDLEAVLDRYQIERCIVLGWSLGGILAMELALQFPERVRGLILVATAARPWSSHPRTSHLEMINTGIAGILNWIYPGWEWNISTFAQRSLFRYLLHQQTPLGYSYLAKEGTLAYLQTSKFAQRALSIALQSRYNRLADLKNIQCPCLVLAGAEDRHITAESSIETAQHLPNAEWYCYPDTAHLFPWEIPNQVLADIEDWLNRYQSQLLA